MKSTRGPTMYSVDTMATRRGLLASAVAGVAGGCLAPWSMAAPVVDPMERPSLVSDRAHSALLTSVARAGKRLVAVGERGTVMLSDDDGFTWRQVSAPVSVMLTGVQFANDQTGWIVGHSGVVLKTTDGGRTWIRQLDGILVAKLLLADARSRSQASPQMDLSRDVAEAERWITDGADKPLLALLTRSQDECLVVGAYGLALRTIDGGKTWQPWTSHMPNEKGGHLYGIAAQGNVVYVAGEMGLVLRSDDGGATFMRQSTPYAGSYFGVAVQDAKTVLLIGLRGRAMVTGDGGISWGQVETGTDASLSHAELLSSGLIAVGSFAGSLYLRHPTTGLFTLVQMDRLEPIVGMAATPGGGMVIVGPRGARRVEAVALGGKGSS